MASPVEAASNISFFTTLVTVQKLGMGVFNLQISVKESVL
jgi:hypothetical protein